MPEELQEMWKKDRDVEDPRIWVSKHKKAMGWTCAYCRQGFSIETMEDDGNGRMVPALQNGPDLENDQKF